MFIDSRFYSILVFVSNMFLLNLLWLILCLPVITIFPATAAMFGVVRQWIIHKDTSVFPAFLRCLKENFKQSFIIQVVWILLAGFLFFDYSISLRLGFLKAIISPILIVLGSLLMLGSSFLFPHIVHFKTKTRNIFVNSFLLSISYIPYSLLLCLLFVLIALVLYIFPVSVLFIGSIGAYIAYWLAHIVFTKVSQRQAPHPQVKHTEVME
ncbi:putative membrane protein YesL [Peribacillus deserti]|uniref:Membrane protein YesL n=1 Tax=Peribacillus deserti TaxID=673318 RepID=A0ABS2QFJ8_9BACI|nr:DUF624 domain-containing protein [Peribacillus deserti]MBM7691750.1 putative membrane protein YesL [Peribacillus deserti]